MKTIISLLTVYLFSYQFALAACVPPEASQSMVAGHTYVQVTEDLYPAHISFSKEDLSAGYGSLVDGHPGGVYSYQGDCHARIKLFFDSFFPANAETVLALHLKPMDAEYNLLVDIHSNTKFQRINE